MPNPSSNIRPRPDSTSAIVGDAGEVVFQAEDGTIATREFPGEDTYGTFEQDITEDKVVAEFDEVGATSRLVAAIESDDEQAFSVDIVWTDELGNAAWRERGLGGTIDSADSYEIEIDGVPTRLSRGRIEITDESGSVSHTVSGVFNIA